MKRFDIANRNIQDWSDVPLYKGEKIAPGQSPATPDKTTIKLGPADKVFTLAPHVVTENRESGDKSC